MLTWKFEIRWKFYAKWHQTQYCHIFSETILKCITAICSGQGRITTVSECFSAFFKFRPIKTSLYCKERHNYRSSGASVFEWKGLDGWGSFYFIIQNTFFRQFPAMQSVKRTVFNKMCVNFTRYAQLFKFQCKIFIQNVQS